MKANYFQVIAKTVKRLIRLFFLSVVFLSGVLIGGIYTPEISSYTQAVDDENKPIKSKPVKRNYIS